MAQTLPNGTVVPNADGGEVISGTGVAEMRTLGSSVDVQLANRPTTAVVDAKDVEASFTKANPGPFDFNTWKKPGTYAMGGAFPTGWSNYPPGITTASILTVYGSPGGTWCAQEVFQYGANPKRFWRVSSSTSTWNPWMDITKAPGGGSAMAGNAALQTDFISKTGGIVNTGGKAGFAIRLDHGWTNIKNKVRAEFIARGIVPGVATNSRNWGLPENSGVSLAEVNTWVANGEFEIINHSATHHGGLNEVQLVDEIVTGKLELESQIPAAAPIFGFAPPGVTEGWDGFNGGRIDGWTSPAARIILESHAYCLGYVGGARRVMDGTIRQGLSHTTLDTYDLQVARNQIDSAIAEKRGIQFMLHTSQLDMPGAITTADFLSFLDYAVAKRDAGDLVFMSPGEMVRGDASLRTPAVHTHAQADVTGLSSALAGKAATSHTHTTAQVTGLDTALAGKAASVHTHTQAQVSGLTDALAGLRTIAPMVIAQGTNLNDVTTPGEWSQQFTAWATQELNYPGGASPVAGRLIVAANIARTQVTQFYIPFTASKLDIYMRNFYNTWGSWERIGMASDLALKANTDHPLLYMSGVRNVASTLLAGWTPAAGGVKLSRQGSTVTAVIDVTRVGDLEANTFDLLPIPSGFRPIVAGYIQPAKSAALGGAVPNPSVNGWWDRLSTSSPLRFRDMPTGERFKDGQRLTNIVTWQTVDAIPTSLPGIPA